MKRDAMKLCPLQQRQLDTVPRMDRMELWTAGTRFLLHRIKTVLKGRVKGIAEIWSERRDSNPQIHDGTLAQNLRFGQLRSPLTDMDDPRFHQPPVAINAAARIPAR